VLSADSSLYLLCASGSWRVGNGTTLKNNVYLGTLTDERLAAAVAGWSTPAFNDAGKEVHDVFIVAAYGVVLQPGRLQ
jgi:hypothetical protein